jgi:two-component system phosphate regulon response regulator OmpR
MKSIKRILLVDDDPEIREIIAGFLSSTEFEVVEASDVETAQLELAKGAPFDLAILDFWLGKNHAVSIMDSVISKSYNIPVIIVSGGNGRMDLEKTEAISDISGAVMFLQKPFHKKDLLHAIAAATL